MAGDGQLISRLRQLLCEFENGGGNGNNGNGNGGLVCEPTKLPCATVCMVCPPPIMAPTVPQPVKPLRLPCPVEDNNVPQMTEEEAERTRYSNFYNNYNVDWHSEGICGTKGRVPDPRKDRCQGVTTDGKTPCCVDYRRRKELEEAARKKKGCPTGFKPCTMKLTPPSDCHPCGVWCAEIQPCPPKARKKVSRYTPGPCRRPCCKHWKPKDPPCKYDEPCRAHCFDHPPGIKPRRERNSAAAC